MTKSLLLMTFSPREMSSSSSLATEFVAEWQKTNLGATVVRRDLGTSPMEGPNQTWIEANMTPRDQRTDAQNAALAASDAAIADLHASTHIVIATPMFNFGLPWQCKSYIDNIVRVNETFGFDPDTGPAPLLDASKKMMVVWSSAFDYAPGTDLNAFDLLTPYIKTVFGFMGVRDIAFVAAGNAWAPVEVADSSRDKARSMLQNATSTW